MEPIEYITETDTSDENMALPSSDTSFSMRKFLMAFFVSWGLAASVGGYLYFACTG